MERKAREFLRILKQAGISYYPEIIARAAASILAKLSRIGIQAHTMVLFGSVARGDYDRWSDVDLLVIGDFSPGFRCLEQAQLECTEPLPIQIQVHPTRLEWFLEDLAHQRLMAIEALEFGITLYDDGSWVQALSKFRRLKRRGLRYLGNRTWQLAGFAPQLNDSK